jgi:exodeoxyribonuclease V gamma subunit
MSFKVNVSMFYCKDWRELQSRHEQPFQVLATQHFIVPNAAVQQWLTEKL